MPAHVAVLLREAVAALAIRADGVYVDGTFGRGGHTRAILAQLGERGRLVGVDRDADAEASAHLIDDPRFVFRRTWFSALPDVLDGLGITCIDGVLLDLGVSSPQLDTPARGFTYRDDGPLDMRMDTSRGETAKNPPRAESRTLAKTEGESKRGKHAQSIEPSLPTKADE